ncbi:MAG: hypothetical protein ACTSUF_10240 [Candidatus Heimdallarchaeaceae archaeon]
MSIPLLDKTLGVIQEGIKYLTLLQKTSHVRKLRAAVDWAEKYILLDEDLKTEDTASKRQQLYARKEYCRKKFFKYNQG